MQSLRQPKGSGGAVFIFIVAYNRILEDEQNRKNCPVIKARGWFALPQGFTIHSKRFDYPADVLVKDLIEPRTDGLPLLRLNTTEASPDQVMKWFDRLMILGIHIPDLNLTNFLGGKVARTLSALILKKKRKKNC